LALGFVAQIPHLRGETLGQAQGRLWGTRIGVGTDEHG